MRTAPVKKGEKKARRGGMSSCVWIPANCLDEETLMSLMSHYVFFFFRLAISFSFPLVTVTHLFSLSTSPLDSSFPPLPLFLFPWSICLPQSPRLPLFPLPALGSVASNAFHSAWLSRHMYPLYIIARTHSLTSVPADLISPSLSSLSPTTPHPNEKTWDLLKKKKKEPRWTDGGSERKGR